jgi:alpha-L-arabinofuranosidase
MGVAAKSGATPILTVNYGSNTSGNGGGTPAFAAAWVQYANVTKGYGVKYWEIGNEVYGNGEYGSA